MQDDSDEVWPAGARQEDPEGEPCCAGSHRDVGSFLEQGLQCFRCLELRTKETGVLGGTRQ